MTIPGPLKRLLTITGMRVVDRCPFKTEFSLWSCDLARGHAGPHHLPWDPRLPANLTRAQQEQWHAGLLEDVLEQRPRHEP